MIGFENRRGFDDYFNASLGVLRDELDQATIQRLERIRKYWNFFEGYHWEEIPLADSPQLTVNYCRAFVNKFVAFELGKSFSMSVHSTVREVIVTDDERTLFKFLEDVWVDNNQFRLSYELGQMKSVTGDAWLQARYFTKEELDDPFEEYKKGRLRILLLPTNIIFPEYDPHDREKLVRLTIMYTYEKTEQKGFFGKKSTRQAIYKQIWDKEKCVIIDDKDEPKEFLNKYGVIPFIQIRNLVIAGKNEGLSDLEDVIPLNVELNLKKSNMSEILDYHAAPVTIVYGAKVGSLEKGANKLWGGLSKDAKVENLELKGDLAASNIYMANLKLSMCEVGSIPETVLGGAASVSNTSGVALQYLNLPLIEKTRMKKMNTEDGLERLNKLIILIALKEKLITIPEGVDTRDFFYNEVTIPDTLPKDALMELQQLQVEMKMGIESREGAAKRMGKENTEDLFAEVDEDMKKHPSLYGVTTPVPTVKSQSQSTIKDLAINSGMTNGETTSELVNKEMTGENKGEVEL